MINFLSDGTGSTPVRRIFNPGSPSDWRIQGFADPDYSTLAGQPFTFNNFSSFLDSAVGLDLLRRANSLYTSNGLTADLEMNMEDFYSNILAANSLLQQANSQYLSDDGTAFENGTYDYITLGTAVANAYRNLDIRRQILDQLQLDPDSLTPQQQVDIFRSIALMNATLNNQGTGTRSNQWGHRMQTNNMNHTPTGVFTDFGLAQNPYFIQNLPSRCLRGVSVPKDSPFYGIRIAGVYRDDKAAPNRQYTTYYYDKDGVLRKTYNSQLGWNLMKKKSKFDVLQTLTKFETDSNFMKKFQSEEADPNLYLQRRRAGGQKSLPNSSRPDYSKMVQQDFTKEEYDKVNGHRQGGRLKLIPRRKTGGIVNQYKEGGPSARLVKASERQAAAQGIADTLIQDEGFMQQYMSAAHNPYSKATAVYAAAPEIFQGGGGVR